ncbi:hypothetical protein DBB33_08015 [Chromobacterium haemolyticum]|nr:hypothetical protein DBB33_08015 [Chromobacterium haemolyticum]
MKSGGRKMILALLCVIRDWYFALEVPRMIDKCHDGSSAVEELPFYRPSVSFCGTAFGFVPERRTLASLCEQRYFIEQIRNVDIEYPDRVL